MDTADAEYRRPDTFRYCAHCDEHVLRSNWAKHAGHDWEARDGYINTTPIRKRNYESHTDDDEDDEPREVGAEYRVDLSYAATHSFTVVAMNETQAKEKAREKIEWGTATDAHSTHDETRKLNTVYEDDEEAEEHNLIP